MSKYLNLQKLAQAAGGDCAREFEEILGEVKSGRHAKDSIVRFASDLHAFASQLEAGVKASTASALPAEKKEVAVVEAKKIKVKAKKSAPKSKKAAPKKKPAPPSRDKLLATCRLIEAAAQDELSAVNKGVATELGLSTHQTAMFFVRAKMPKLRANFLKQLKAHRLATPARLNILARSFRKLGAKVTVAQLKKEAAGV